MIDYFVFNGRSSKDFGVVIADHSGFDAPERDYSVVEIPGMNGDLTVDNGRYKNIDVEYQCSIQHDFRDKMSHLRGWLYSSPGYQRLEDSFDPECYRIARVSGGLDVKTQAKFRFGEFKITFDCKPQRWLKLGEDQITLAASNAVYNPTMYDAHPIFELTGNGTIVIGSNTITVANNTGTMILDTELGDAYDKTSHANLNSCVTVTNNDFPALKPGLNNITKSNFTTAKMTPRWWTL